MDRAVSRRSQGRDGIVPPRRTICDRSGGGDRPHGDDGAAATRPAGIESGVGGGVARARPWGLDERDCRFAARGGPFARPRRTAGSPAARRASRRPSRRRTRRHSRRAVRRDRPRGRRGGGGGGGGGGGTSGG